MGGRRGRLLGIATGLGLAMAGEAAQAGPPGFGPRFGGARPAGPGFHQPVPGMASSAGLREFQARARFEAGSELRAQIREANRRSEESWLRAHGTAEALERHRLRALAEDALAERAEVQAAERIPDAWGYGRFAPVTRRLLERSRIELRWTERRRERDLRLQELEREMAARGSRDVFRDLYRALSGGR
jgi:hypothetical protein